ncbi:MAG: hypothetical protein P8X92_00290 [Dehalococcoidia bacterium]
MTEEEINQTTESKARKVARRILGHENTVLGLILIVLISIFAVLTKGGNLTQRNVLGVLVQSSVRGIAAMGQTFVILTGGIDLSQGSIALLTMAMAGEYMQGRVGIQPTA